MSSFIVLSEGAGEGGGPMYLTGTKGHRNGYMSKPMSR